MAGVIMIFLFGSRNVLHIGWTVWTIASFTTYLSCFTKLAKKASNSAKLFNAVQKAEVSWHRIKPFLKEQPEREKAKEAEAALLEVQNVSFGYVPEKQLFSNVSFQAEPGEIIGITGPIASGKSTFGRVFLQEYPYMGKILYAGKNISLLRNTEIFAYAGHDPQLFTGTIRENICLGTENDQRLHEVIEEVCMQDEISSFANGSETVLGEAGSRLSGGQQARISLARALFSKAPVLILDDPFSAVDRHTEESIFNYLKTRESNRIIILISHRLHVFPQTDQVIWINEGSAQVSSHDSLLINMSAYKQLYVMQEGEENA
jgi:ATP-binding cassette subfamily B protein